jgi:flagellar export protein FliJ
MTRAPIPALSIVARLRHRAVDAARQELAEALETEAQAARALRAAGAAILREQHAAAQIDAPDSLAEAFARWLPRGRLAQEMAAEALSRAEDGTARARACLGAARAAAEAVEALQASRAAEHRAAAARHDQQALDDIGQHPRR